MTKARLSFGALVIALLLQARAYADDGAGHSAPRAPGEHAHPSPHGGQVVTAGKYHFELVVHSDEVHIYLLSDTMKPLPVKEVTGTIQVVASGSSAQRADLKAETDALEAKLDLSKLDKFVALVTVVIDGKPQSARFAVERDGAHHGDGTPSSHHHGESPPAQQHHHGHVGIGWPTPRGGTGAGERGPKGDHW